MTSTNPRNLTESAIWIFLYVAATAVTTLTAIAANAYTLPLRANDLEAGERYQTSVHKPGIQAEGKDIGARRYKSDSSWPNLKTDGADKQDLDNWIVYGKPFYAMAEGVIIRCWRNSPNNPVGGLHAEYEKGFIGGGGNSIVVLHDDSTETLYAHAKPGSIPSAICPNDDTLFKFKGGKGESDVTNGVRVKAGQMLGRVGNSGASSSGPHLHVHMHKNGAAAVMKFDRGMTADFTGSKSSINGPWTPLAGKTLPKATILVWPPHSVGNYTWNGTNDEDYQRLFDHMSDSGMMLDIVTCKNNGQTYDSKWVPAKGDWVSHHDMTAATATEKQAFYTMKGFTRTSSFTCGSRQVAVWRKL